MLVSLLVITMASSSAQAQSESLCPEALPVQATLEFESGETEGSEDGVLAPREVATIKTTVVYKAPAQAWSLEPVPVTINATASHPDWAEVSPSEQSALVEVDPTQTEDHEETITFETNITLNDDAPHGEIVEAIFTTSSGSGNCVHEAEPTSYHHPVYVGFQGKWNAGVNISSLSGAPGESLTIDGRIQSDSNGPIDFTFEPLDKAEHGTLELPASLVVPGGSEEEFTLRYHAASKGMEEIQVRISGVALYDRNIVLEEQIVNFSVDNRNDVEEEELPAPAPMIVVVAVLGLVFAALKRRR